MRVKDIMTINPKTVKPDTPVKEAAMMMVMAHISGTPVVDDDNNLVGILSEKDILQHMFPDLNETMNDTKPDFEEMERNYKSTIHMTVKDLMISNVATVTPDMPCLKAASMMWLRKFRRIPVAENGKLVGIVSIGDVHRAIFKSSMED